MSIKIVKGNVVDAVLNGDCHFMLHISNAQKTMGSGVAKEVRERIPSAYTNYMEKPKNVPNISFSDNLNCVNLTAQQYYGYDRKRYLKYDWLIHCLFALTDYDFELQDNFETGNLKIAIPYLMGCDRAGGDWETVCEILQAFLGHHEIIAYKL